MADDERRNRRNEGLFSTEIFIFVFTAVFLFIFFYRGGFPALESICRFRPLINSLPKLKNELLTFLLAKLEDGSDFQALWTELQSEELLRSIYQNNWFDECLSWWKYILSAVSAAVIFREVFHNNTFIPLEFAMGFRVKLRDIMNFLFVIALLILLGFISTELILATEINLKSSLTNQVRHRLDSSKKVEATVFSKKTGQEKLYWTADSLNLPAPLNNKNEWIVEKKVVLSETRGLLEQRISELFLSPLSKVNQENGKVVEIQKIQRKSDKKTLLWNETNKLPEGWESLSTVKLPEMQAQFELQISDLFVKNEVLEKTKSKVLIDRLSFNPDPRWDNQESPFLKGPGNRKVTGRVKFPQGYFKDAPKVTPTVKMLDADVKNFASSIRYNIVISDVSSAGFTAEVHTWSDSVIWTIHVDYIAVGQ